MTDTLEEMDAIILEKLDAQLEVWRLRMVLASQEAEKQVIAIRAKYGMGDGDTWNLEKRQVLRKPAPAAPAAPEPLG